ncbi:hypothetical protein F4561_004742 [Lipingzhangella halophila]|uniref:Uncharacterized protein n=1 Tax=Lipingzhangella halophila TaxID=1783352 RepID=A0A7W7RLC9_9ACTN|nr:hypothetical protein [Lipingzhangella halophila]
MPQPTLARFQGWRALAAPVGRTATRPQHN